MEQKILILEQYFKKKVVNTTFGSLSNYNLNRFSKAIILLSTIYHSVVQWEKSKRKLGIIKILHSRSKSKDAVRCTQKKCTK